MQSLIHWQLHKIKHVYKRHLVELIFLHVVKLHNSNQLEAHGGCWDGYLVGWLVGSLVGRSGRSSRWRDQLDSECRGTNE